MNHRILLNIKSGFFISLIALPLCLGIALASSCPPIAGVLTAMIGGLVVSLIGGCNLSIKGPAAGLIAVVLATVNDLGEGDLAIGYKRMLGVAAMAAILQIIFALLKTAQLGRLLPLSVVQGMLAALGIIILAKQVHIVLGAIPHGKTPLALLREIPDSFLNINPELAFIGIFTLCAIIVIPLFSNRLTKNIPPALIALSVVIPLGLIWHLDYHHVYHFLEHDFAIGPEYLVNIPQNLFSSLVIPDFSILTKPLAYKYAVMLALVGSMESVLTVIAVDSISKKKSSLDRDLLAVGIGNFLCAMIGGLPMISEVVRSKANIDSGATGRSSNFFHGVFLLIFVTALTPIIRSIPLAALAAMLMVAGYRLASPYQFLQIRKVGLDQLFLFSTTLILTLATDLLTGIMCGFALKLLIHLSRGVKLRQIFTISIEVDDSARVTKLLILSPAICSNYFSLQKKILEAHSQAKKVEIDFSNTTLVDHTTLSSLDALKKEVGDNKLILSGLDKLNPLSSHQLSTHRLVSRQI